MSLAGIARFKPDNERSELGDVSLLQEKTAYPCNMRRAGVSARAPQVGNEKILAEVQSNILPQGRE
jgi:hypothetical protein